MLFLSGASSLAALRPKGTVFSPVLVFSQILSQKRIHFPQCFADVGRTARGGSGSGFQACSPVAFSCVIMAFQCYSNAQDLPNYTDCVGIILISNLIDWSLMLQANSRALIMDCCIASETLKHHPRNESFCRTTCSSYFICVCLRRSMNALFID